MIRSKVDLTHLDEFVNHHEEEFSTEAKADYERWRTAPEESAGEFRCDVLPQKFARIVDQIQSVNGLSDQFQDLYMFILNGRASILGWRPNGVLPFYDGEMSSLWASLSKISPQEAAEEEKAGIV